MKSVSEIDLPHGNLRFNWRMLLANGTVFMDGIDVAELAPDDRLLLGIVGKWCEGRLHHMCAAHAVRRQSARV